MGFWNKKQRKTEEKVSKTAVTIFEQWKKLAHPILTDIIEKSGYKLEGFVFYESEPASSISYSSGVAISKIHVNEDGTYSLSIGDNDYPEHLTPMEFRDTSKRLADRMLDGLEDVNYPYKPNNRRRNNLVQEIEKRTGRNLKREVCDLYPAH